MAQTVASNVAVPHRNNGLFSDHYLNITLPGRADWQELGAEARPVRAAIASLYAAYTPSENEAQLERELIRPALAALGHTFEVQAPLATPDGTKRPDYVFYRDLAALNSAKNKTLTDALLRGKAFAVGDAKAWERPLDIAAKGRSADPLTNKNPSYQIAFYMQHSGVAWGILTNGRLWRLYHRDSAHKLDRYYEVDLPALLERGDTDDFLYFYGFFRRGAFEPGPLGVAALLQESLTYALEIGDTLKRQVYDALRHLAQGFLDYQQNGLSPDAATLKEIYDNALIVLYRLLFILYAEARGLLPVQESARYRDTYSLQATKEAVARDLDAGRLLLPTSARLWPTLVDLFDIIDRGSPPLKVATFDGGLFDPARHPFLTRYTVGDAHLQRAIDKLARVGGQFVDYRDLAERHLGTIYEGLLEYHLRPDDAEQGWTVALLNDKGERHATGSYYTPDDIVKYMVDATLGPTLRAAVAGAGNDAERVARVLAIDVLDPAMGSGHFLVEATEYIARFLVELGARESEAGGEADLAYWRRRVAQSCIYGVDLNPLAVDLAKLSLWLNTVAKDRPLSFLDHHLRAGNALVGTRIANLRRGGATAPKKTGKKSPRAATPGQLTFFSDDLFRQRMSTAVDSMFLIEDSPARTIADVKEQEQAYASLRRELIGKYGTLANLETATEFGLQVDPALWPSLVDYAGGRSPIGPPAKLRAQLDEILAEAGRIAAERGIFHWELEFPEVFFNRHGEAKGAGAGFDAVIGNPPYVRQEGLGPFKPYFERAYAETYDGVADLYVYFYQRGLQLTRAGGRMAYIVTNKWMRAGYGEKLRAYFAAQGALERIVDFGHAPIFADADVFPCIVVLQKQGPEAGDAGQSGQVAVTAFPREELGKVELGAYIDAHSHLVPRSRFTNRAWSLEAAAVDDVLAKICRAGKPLTVYAGVRPLVGIKTGFNDAFLVSSRVRNRLIEVHPSLKAHIKPYLRGRDIKRWAASWEELWILLIKSSSDFAWPWANLQPEQAEAVFRTSYPALYEHVALWKDQLESRSDKGRFWWELRSCSYYDTFDRGNIFYQDLAYHSRFCAALPGTIAEMTSFCLPTTDKWLLAVLNSPLMWAYMWRNVIHGKDEVLRLKTIYMEALPVAPPADEIRAEVEPAVVRLIEIARANTEARRIMLDWLRVELGVETPGQRLEDFARLDADAFVEEVRKRRPKKGGALTPALLKVLREGYAEQARPVRERRAEAERLERRLSDLVNAAYGLTPAEVALLWATAPPRMPVGRP